MEKLKEIKCEILLDIGVNDADIKNIKKAISMIKGVYVICHIHKKEKEILCTCNRIR